MPWFVYQPAKKFVHQVSGCDDSHPSPVKQRTWPQVGHQTWETLDEAVEVARELLDAEAQPCRRCQRLFGIGRGISDDTWSDMVDRALGRDRHD